MFKKYTTIENFIGEITDINLNKVTVTAKNLDNLRRLQIGHFVIIDIFPDIIIGIVDKLNFVEAVFSELFIDDDNMVRNPVQQKTGTVGIILIGMVDQGFKFNRSLSRLPTVNSGAYNIDLSLFEKIFSQGQGASQFRVGEYSLFPDIAVNVDGNKFFQRHAALLGSTGAGKSWAVTSILEKAKDLEASNMIVFDLHGEYSELNYASCVKIPGPDDRIGSLLHLPYWLLDSGELISMFIDSKEFTAHNQVSVLQAAINRHKKEWIKSSDLSEDIMSSLTINSPVPFSIIDVLEDLKRLNNEMTQGSTGRLKQGQYYGQLTRLISRINNKINDKRFGFLFNNSMHDIMLDIVSKILSIESLNIKVIDFSEVPSEMLPNIIGLVGRLIYQIQFWTNASDRKPVVLVLDEAHIYLPSKEHQNPAMIRSIKTFEQIAKEGRKYGVGMFVISQRPSDISDTILSQMSNIVSLRLTNPKDQATIQKLMPDSLGGLVENLPVLGIGEAVFIGDAVPFPTRVRLDKPKQPPLSNTIDFWDEWQHSERKDNDFKETINNMRRQGRTK